MRLIKNFTLNRIKKKLKGIEQQRLSGQPSDDILKKEIALYHKLVNIYRSLLGHKKYPFAREEAQEALRAASALDDTEAQYLLGNELIDEANLRHELQEGEICASQSNEDRMENLYREGLTYITAASKKKHILAMRKLGLCHIHGWGMPADLEKGMEYIMHSIDEEGGWGKVPQIFASIGLNKPEFFAALTKFRKNS